MATEQSTSKTDLYALSKDVLAQLPAICQHFNVPVWKTDKYFYGPCPVHGGDNENAFRMYHTGHSHAGNWYCETRACQETFVNSPIGFVRGILSRQKYDWMGEGDPTASFPETLRWIENFLGLNLGAYSKDSSSNDSFSYLSNIFAQERAVGHTGVTRDQVRASLEIPSKYFLKRNYLPETLDMYDVGNCYEAGKEMNQRAVVPVYNDDGTYMIGCTGRTIHDQCEYCGVFHAPRGRCPSEDFKHLYGKWKHSKSLDCDTFLYNYHFAKPHIERTGTVVLVESPGNIWRLEEAGIHNGVCTFGAKLSKMQKMLLQQTWALSIVVIGDPDKAGQKMNQKVYDSCKDEFNVYPVKIDFDIGDSFPARVKDYVGPIVERAKL